MLPTSTAFPLAADQASAAEAPSLKAADTPKEAFCSLSAWNPLKTVAKAVTATTIPVIAKPIGFATERPRNAVANKPVPVAAADAPTPAPIIIPFKAPKIPAALIAKPVVISTAVPKPPTTKATALKPPIIGPIKSRNGFKDLKTSRNPPAIKSRVSKNCMA